MTTSPSTDNLFVGKGNVYMKAVDADDATYAHIGNCPKFSVVQHFDVLEYFKDSAGVAVLEDVQLRLRGADINISAEEFTPENLAVAFGAVSVGGSVYRIQNSIVSRAVKLVGSNEKGQKVQVFAPKVIFTSEGEVEFISEQYAAMPLNGRCMFYRIAAVSSTKSFIDFTFLA